MLFHNWHRVGDGFRCVHCHEYTRTCPQDPCVRKSRVVRRARPLEIPMRKAREL